MFSCVTLSELLTFIELSFLVLKRKEITERSAMRIKAESADKVPQAVFGIGSGLCKCQPTLFCGAVKALERN